MTPRAGPSTFGAPIRREGVGRNELRVTRSDGQPGSVLEGRKFMAAKKKAAKGGGELIISKSRTKAAAKKCNVGGEFYGALDAAVRKLIAEAEARAVGNKRKTLKAVDL